jgi:predicted CXXCH cytochrome family protein
MGYPVAKARCTSCHDPHGSNTSGILFDTVHMPVANKQCSQCHEAPSSPTPFQVKRMSFELCRGCHNSMMTETFSQNRIHWPLVDKTGCLNCHQPHASTQKKLLTEKVPDLCARCHADTFTRQGKTLSKHKPVKEGDCMSCHAPHAANRTFLLSQGSIIDLCGSCHDWQKHSSHPIGEKSVDPRNKNLTLDCLSCHRSHGTDYKWMLPFPTSTDLCTQCHKELKR